MDFGGHRPEIDEFVFRDKWRHLEKKEIVSGDKLRHLATFGYKWRHLETNGDRFLFNGRQMSMSRKIYEYDSGDIWRYLETFGNIWKQNALLGSQSWPTLADQILIWSRESNMSSLTHSVSQSHRKHFCDVRVFVTGLSFVSLFVG